MTPQIVKMKYSSTIYVDDYFYREGLEERPQNESGNKSYPVRLTSFRVDWILNSEHGSVFLTKLYNNENIEIYAMKTMKMMIEFLYQELKFEIIYYQAPFYLLNLGSFLAMAYANEIFVQKIVIDSGTKTIEGIEKSRESMHWLRTFIIVNLIFTMIQCYKNIQIMRHMGWMYFKRLNSWIDIVIAIICIII